MSEKDVPIRNLILVPAVITFAVTLLRLFGELQGWSERFFNRAAGGQGALVGIVWLVFVFGLYFGWKLAAMGQRPPSIGGAIGWSVGALAVVVVVLFGLNAIHAGLVPQIVGIGASGLAAAYLATRGWPALGRVLVAYALAARIPVALVMLAAMLGNWGTHYDVAPPDFPAMGVWTKWLLIGVMPQLTLWIAFTVVFGTLFGLLGLALARGRQPAVTGM